MVFSTGALLNMTELDGFF